MSEVPAEVFPLVSTGDVAALSDWVCAALGLTESWRAEDGGVVEHAEVEWLHGRISLNVTKPDSAPGPCGIGLRVDDRDQVDAIHARAVAAGAEIIQGPEESRVAYSFTARDPDGNQWWVNAETGFLDELRKRRS